MDPHTRRIALGRLEIDYCGRDFISDAALAEIEYQSRDCTRCAGRLTCRFGTIDDPADGAVQVDRFLVGPDVVRIGDRLLPHSLRWTGSNLEVAVRSARGHWQKPLIAPTVRLVDQSFDDAARRLSKRFYYTVFEQAVQLAQVPLGQSWVHSSAVTDGDRTVLFMAWGGVGKTAALLQLLETGSWRFLADDLAVLDVDGTVYRTPQRMQVFAANLVGQDALRARLLAGRSPADRALWVARRRVLGDRSVRRRVHAEDLYGADAVAVSARATDAIYLRRTTATCFTTDESTPRELARLGAAVLDAELEPLGRWLAAIHGAASNTDWPTRAEMAAATASVIEAGLAGSRARCVVVGVPQRCGPDELFRFIQDRVLA